MLIEWQKKEKVAGRDTGRASMVAVKDWWHGDTKVKFYKLGGNYRVSPRLAPKTIVEMECNLKGKEIGEVVKKKKSTWFGFGAKILQRRSGKMLCPAAWVMNKKNFQNADKSTNSVTLYWKASCCPQPTLFDTNDVVPSQAILLKWGDNVCIGGSCWRMRLVLNFSVTHFGAVVETVDILRCFNSIHIWLSLG